MSSPVIALEMPREVLDSARLTLPDLKIEIAVTLYTQNRLALSLARELADCSPGNAAKFWRQAERPKTP
jgi:predicted HTH domain antitoxin